MQTKTVLCESTLFQLHNDEIRAISENEPIFDVFQIISVWNVFRIVISNEETDLFF